MTAQDVIEAHPQIFAVSELSVRSEEWLKLIDAVCVIASSYGEQHNVQFHAMQVKVKWGDLRFYWAMSPNDETTHEHWDFFSALISHLEEVCRERE